jgi:hypothetical protein
VLGRCWEGQYRSCSERRPLVAIHGRLPPGLPGAGHRVQSPGAATCATILSAAKGLRQTGPEVTRSPRPTTPGRVPDSLPLPAGRAGGRRPAHARAGSQLPLRRIHAPPRGEQAVPRVAAGPNR